MAIGNFAQWRAVQAVARHRSFRAAATELGMSRSALSHAIAAVEADLGLRLFHRTTRSVALTEAGEQFLTDIRDPLSALLRAIDDAGSRHAKPAGTLRINASSGAARQIMQPIILAYARQFPDVTIDLVTDGKLTDIVAAGFDAGIRLAESVPKDMIALRLGPDQRCAVVGSPQYFQDRPLPLVPMDLAQHRCIRIRLPGGALYRWEFERHGETTAIDGPGPLILDEPLLMLDAARAGLGLAYLSEWNVAEDLATGRLVRVLEEWTPFFPGLCLYYSGRRHVPSALRALINLVRDDTSRQA